MSSLVTIVTIVVAYIGQALRPVRYSSLDKVLIRYDPGAPINEKERAWRIEALESFLKTLSDQQLFIALALTLAIYLLRYGVSGLDAKVSAYSFCLAVNIALLSCTVHLAAMTILREHFDKLKWPRNIRVVIMVVTMGCLIPQLVTMQFLDSAVTLRCALDPAESDPNDIWEQTVYALTLVLATTAIIATIVFGYLRRLFELYSTLFRESPERWVARLCYWIRQLPFIDDKHKFNQEAASHHAKQSSEVRTYSGMLLYWRILRIVTLEVRRSFIAELIWISFYTILASCLMIYFLSSGTDPGQSPVSFTVGFGQVLPLVLLGLPALSAAELFSGGLHGETGLICHLANKSKRTTK